MTTELLNVFIVLAYLVVGTAAIAALMRWGLKRFGWPAPPPSRIAPIGFDAATWPKTGHSSGPNTNHRPPGPHAVRPGAPPS